MSSFDIDVTRDGGCSGHRGAHRRRRRAVRRPRSAQNGIPASWASSSSTRRFFSASVIGVRDLD